MIQLQDFPTAAKHMTNLEWVFEVQIVHFPPNTWSKRWETSIHTTDKKRLQFVTRRKVL